MKFHIGTAVNVAECASPPAPKSLTRKVKDRVTVNLRSAASPRSDQSHHTLSLSVPPPPPRRSSPVAMANTYVARLLK